MEVLIPFGKSKNGSLVFIDEVTSGLACDCVCISCGMALSAGQDHELYLDLKV